MAEKQVSQRASQTVGSQSRTVKSKQSQKTRQITSERSLLRDSESRDELAKTFFNYNARRKRSYENTEEEEKNDSSLSSPFKAVYNIPTTVHPS